MEYGHSTDYDRSIHQDFSAYGHSGSPRDWFATDHKFAATTENSSDLLMMEEYPPPATNENHYNSYRQNHHQQQPQTLGIDNGELHICNIEREHMFDKVVTPSDVGKLNRLVIPKQHAEKYFPLDSSSNEKGMLLDFEDLTCKPWRFRYSYWNSSQSYVMTKGWSRFVKEKKLEAGDIVSFQRGVIDKHRFFIHWKRRPILPRQLPVDVSYFHSQFYRSNGGILPSWSPFLFRPPPNRVHPGMNFQIQNPSNHNYYYTGYGNNGINYASQVVSNNASVVYLSTNPGERSLGMVQKIGGGERTIPVVVQGNKKRLGSGVAKKLRLFGVNMMECPAISSDTTSTSDEFEMLTSSSSIPLNTPTTAHHLINQYPSSPASMHPSSTRVYNGAPISNKGKKSMSLDLEIG